MADENPDEKEKLEKKQKILTNYFDGFRESENKDNKKDKAPDQTSVASVILEPGESVDVMKLFNEWCLREGVIMPKIQYPANFNGLNGIGTRETIKHREVFERCS